MTIKVTRCTMCEEKSNIVRVVDIAGPGWIQVQDEWQDHSDYHTYHLCADCAPWADCLVTRKTIVH